MAAENFAKDPSKSSGFKSMCKSCDAARCREYYERKGREVKRAYYANLPPEKSRNKPPGSRKCTLCDMPAVSNRHHYCADCGAVRAAIRRASRDKRDATRPRPKNSERGYGYEHRKLRAKWREIIEHAGGVHCARCGFWISSEEPWDLGHDDRDRSKYSGPEHRRCNRSTASHRRARSRPTFSRQW